MIAILRAGVPQDQVDNLNERGLVDAVTLNGLLSSIERAEAIERVANWHQAHSFVRGNWRRESESTFMLLAKCCHDIDLITWFKSGVEPVSVDSMGGINFFNAANAPANSGKYCLIDCPLEHTCDFSVRRLHLNNPIRWQHWVLNA